MPLPYCACIHELYVKPRFIRSYLITKSGIMQEKPEWIPLRFSKNGITT